LIAIRHISLLICITILCSCTSVHNRQKKNHERTYTIKSLSGTDITNELKNAIKNYDKIIIAPGKYTVSSQITLRNNIKIEGNNATICMVSPQDFSLFKANNCHKISINNLKIIGRKPNNTAKFNSNHDVFVLDLNIVTTKWF
jgi:hypothetical protein